MIGLVTGSNGFLGTFFRKYFFDGGHTFIYGTTSDVCDGNLVKFESLYDDIEVKLADQKIDVIIHFASVIPKSFKNATYELFLKNVRMMHNLYQFSIKKGVVKFIYISGFGSMENPQILDIKDFYTLSKIVGEHFCSMMCEFGIKAVSFRISAPYGEFYRSRNVIRIFVEKALKNEEIMVFGSGKREQKFTYAGEVMFAINLALKKDVTGIYEIVSEKNISMLALAKLVKKLTRSKSRILTNTFPDPQEDYKPRYSYKKAYKVFGYRPKYSIEEGLRRYIEWYRKRLDSV